VVKRGYGSSTTLLYAGIAALLLVAALIALSLIWATALGGSFIVDSLWAIFPDLAMFALLGSWFILQRRESVRFDARRQAAAAGNGAVLSLAMLGMAESTPLTLPTTIRTRLAWRSWFWRIMFLVFLALMQVVAIGATLTYRPQPGQWPGILYFLASDAGAIAMLLLVFLIVSLAARGRFTVTNDGLSTRYFGVPQLVRWQDARLFARVAGEKFELSSPLGIVRFSLLSDEGFRTSTIPFNQYRAEMSAVFAMITERTGLPLIDLYAPKKR
jgi:hypothetical protein